MKDLKKEIDRVAIELENQGWCELFDGLCIYDKESILEEQKEWNEFDEYKNFDFTSSPYWILGAGVHAIQDEADFQSWLKEAQNG